MFNNKLYILGGFDTITDGGQGTNQIWEFTPPYQLGAEELLSCLFRSATYRPTTIGSLIYTGGGTDITGGTAHRYYKLFCL